MFQQWSSAGGNDDSFFVQACAQLGSIRGVCVFYHSGLCHKGVQAYLFNGYKEMERGTRKAGDRNGLNTA